MLQATRRFKEIEGKHLALVISVNLFVAVIPLLIIIYAFAEAFSPHRSFGALVVKDLHLTPLRGFQKYLRGAGWLVLLLAFTVDALALRGLAAGRPFWFTLVLAPVLHDQLPWARPIRPGFERDLRPGIMSSQEVIPSGLCDRRFLRASMERQTNRR